MRDRTLDRQSGFTLIEVMIAMALLAALVLSITALSKAFLQARASAQTSIDYSNLVTNINNILLNDNFCSIALQNQTMLQAGANPVILKDTSGATRYQVGTRVGSLTIAGITLSRFAGPYANPGGIAPFVMSAVLTVTATRSPNDVPAGSPPLTFAGYLSVTTDAANQISKCTRVKFSEKNYVTDPCPATQPVVGCTANGGNVPMNLGVAADGTTMTCTPDYTQCCDHATSYAVMDAGAVSCRPYYCTATASDTYAQAKCAANVLPPP